MPTDHLGRGIAHRLRLLEDSIGKENNPLYDEIRKKILEIAQEAWDIDARQ